MRRLFIIRGLRAGEGGWLAVFAGLVALLGFSVSPSLLQAMRVRVREGLEVRIALSNILTTENAQKDDVIQFQVAEDVVVAGHTVIAKGAPSTGKVVRIKGAGKKKAKDASVTFRLLSVQTVDKQEVQLRKHATEEKKKNDKESEFEEDQPIPGQVERVIGADKGKLFIAYLDAPVDVNAPDTQPSPPAPVATGQGSNAPAGQPATPVVSPLAQPTQGPAIVDFRTDPSGADIMIDGNFAGNTPSSLQVPPGRHTVELRMAGYHTFKRTMQVDEGSHPSVSTTLEKD